MNRISNYDELLAERRRIESNIAEQKLIINKGITDIKNKLEPFLNLLPILNVFKKKEPATTSLLQVATSLGIDLIVGQRLLSKASWMTRLVVPMVLKLFSSRIIGRNHKINEITRSNN